MKSKQLTIKLVSSVDSSYPIKYLDSLNDVARDIKRNFNRPVLFIVTDRNVANYHAKKFFTRVRTAYDQAHLIVIPAGERSKSRHEKEVIEDAMLRRGVSRDSLLIVMGGGMIGDIGGFTAATLLRGIDFIQIPTSLLAQVDSSIGGKVGINHPRGKNLIGAFYQPRAVYIAIRLLRTLPEREFINGLAEVIKYASILDEDLFGYLEKHRDAILARNLKTLSTVIHQCCRLKKTIVEADEKEQGLRRILNFGHTIGHAIEKLSNYRYRHGEAIAIGMVQEARMSVRLGFLEQNECDRLTSLIKAYGLPAAIPGGMTSSQIVKLTQDDKKKLGGKIHYTLLQSIGGGRPGIALTPAQAITALRG